MATNTVQRGFGSGSPTQELERWLREAGRVTVIDEGEQLSLLSPNASRMYRLYNKRGDSIQLTAETAHSYGYRPTRRAARTEAAPDLFSMQSELL